MNRRNHVFSFAIAAVACLGAAQVSLADPIAQESFDYPPQTLAGQNGGVGWSGTWKADASLSTDSTVAVQDNSLSAPSGYLTSPTGGSAVAPDGSLLIMYRALGSGIDLDTDQDYYVSLLMRRTGTPKSSTFALQAGSTTVAQFGHGTGGSTFVGGIGSTVAASTNDIGSGPTYLFVFKIAAKSGSGQDQLFLSTYRSEFGETPSQTVPPTEPEDWDVVGNPAAVNDTLTQFAVLRSDDGQLEVDEIRIGTSYADVAAVPEPATLGLMGLSGLLALCRRR